MYKKIVSLIIIALLFSCKSKQKLTQTVPNIETDKTITVEKCIQKHNDVKLDFKTAYIKADVDYKDNKQSIGLSADIRIKKDEIILLSVKFFGITMAKAIITPDLVRYYEKSGGTFFEGDYKTLSNWLGSDLDFIKIQNMMLGKTIDNLFLGKYEFEMQNNNYTLTEVDQANIAKLYTFSPDNFWLKKQEIVQKSPSKSLKVDYLNYKSYPEAVLPEELLIFASQSNNTTTISIAYKSVSFNEEMTFPYSVPDGFKKITIN
jgi:hypothetical protein